MTDFDLDLRSAEDQIDADEGDDPGRIELGVLDGTTPDDEWLEAVEAGRTLVLDIKGDVNDLAAGFARDITEAGGDLVHFRGFLVVTPPSVEVDTDRL